MAIPSTQPARKQLAAKKGQEKTVVRASRMASLWKHLSNPLRLQVLLALADGKKSLCQIGERLGRNSEELSYQLALLCDARMVDSHWEGYEAYYELTEPGAGLIDGTLKLLEKAGPSPKPVLTKSEWKKLVKEAGSAVDDPEDWLNTPNPRFEGRRPLDLVGTREERRVHIIIGAARQGFFS